MEARIARLEADVAHLRSAAGDIKEDVRGLRDRFEAKFDAVIAAVAALKDSIAGTRAEVEGVKRDVMAAVATVKVWAVLLHLALTAATFGTMARGFGWI